MVPAGAGCYSPIGGDGYNLIGPINFCAVVLTLCYATTCWGYADDYDVFATIHPSLSSTLWSASPSTPAHSGANTYARTR
jgi:hypothetical protein